ETLAAVASEHGSYATLVTGPSRTADIERQLTVGVQGPARLHVVFIERTV
ncbi:MAG: lactate utilization protein, partial [Chloroflexota bacterium]|nr:lactate utilization protein [Chloroflexota bacterium]